MSCFPRKRWCWQEIRSRGSWIWRVGRLGIEICFGKLICFRFGENRNVFSLSHISWTKRNTENVIAFILKRINRRWLIKGIVLIAIPCLSTWIWQPLGYFLISMFQIFYFLLQPINLMKQFSCLCLFIFNWVVDHSSWNFATGDYCVFMSSRVSQSDVLHQSFQFGKSSNHLHIHWFVQWSLFILSQPFSNPVQNISPWNFSLEIYWIRFYQFPIFQFPS